MKKSIRLVLVSIICFFSILCFAETTTIAIDNKNLVLPHFDGFKLISDRESIEFKKIEDQYTSDKNTIPYAHYYETNPGKLTRLISIYGYKEKPNYLTKKQWLQAKNSIYEDSQKPRTIEQVDAKYVQTIIESVIDHDLYNSYITETKVFLKENNKSDYVYSILDAKTYINVNGRIVIIFINIEGDNAYNVSTLEWAKVISKAAAEKIIELNPPTQQELAAAKSTERKEQLDHIKYVLLIIVGLLALLWKYRFKYLPQSLHHYVKSAKAEAAAVEKSPK
jgi:hypothetical protein